VPGLDDRSRRIGAGVAVETVVRTYDSALETNLRQTIRQDGYYQAYTQQLVNVEGMLAPDGTSPLAAAVTDFATSLSQLDTAPDSRAARTAVIDRGGALADGINRTRSQLVALRDSIADTNGKGLLSETVDSANGLARQIADLNRQISQAEQRRFKPQQANNLRDRREQLTRELSRMADVTVEEQDDGMWNLKLDGGNLVSGTTVNPLALNTGGPAPTVVWADSGAVAAQDGGRIQGLVEAAAYIRSTIAEIDNFSTQLADALNAQHAAGFDRYDTPGAALFDASDPANVRFLPSDPERLAAATGPGLSADGTNAAALLAVLERPLPALDNDSLLSRPDRIVDSIAVDTASAVSLAEGAAAGITMFENAIGEVSGVDVDEEMLVMLDTQRAYQASARFVGVVDDMLAEIIQMV
jgi:flagellar hook-associated protein 1 FlgK